MALALEMWRKSVKFWGCGNFRENCTILVNAFMVFYIQGVLDEYRMAYFSQNGDRNPTTWVLSALKITCHVFWRRLIAPPHPYCTGCEKILNNWAFEVIICRIAPQGVILSKFLEEQKILWINFPTGRVHFSS